jgi:diguanylate cyclase (GGDEF)-like protein/PAS domain S-box-containing protein
MNDARFRSLIEQSLDLIFIVSPDGTIDYAGPSVESVLGGDGASMVGNRLEDFVHPEDLETAQHFISRIVAEPESRGRQVLRMQATDGEWLYIENIAANRVRDPEINGILVNGRDVTERVALEQRLSFEALHDSLTGLANRVLFKDRVAKAMVRSGEQAGSAAVVMLDLDRFKNVNDTLGHGAGDELLTSTAARLLSATRGSDTVARLGGDEFAVLLTGIHGKEDVMPVLNRIETMLQRPFWIGGREIVASGSLGIAIGGEGSDAAELLRRADVAMYAAKVVERTVSSRFFQPEMLEAAHHRAQLEVDLRTAVEKGQLRIAYQPLMGLTNRKAYGVEALLRWDHPDRGTIEPDEFIPMAEDTGLIVGMGRWVLHQACRTVSDWQRRSGRKEPLLLSVNVSARQLVDEHIVTDVAEALASSGLAPGSLFLELTESTLIEDTSIVMQRLADLRALGVKLAIDDFGTGYSSLAYLRTFPIDMLKIDRRFVADLDRGGSSAVLAKAVLGLGATLSLRTVAEGIERDTQLSELLEMGCQYGQGFLFAGPLSVSEAETFIEDDPL